MEAQELCFVSKIWEKVFDLFTLHHYGEKALLGHSKMMCLHTHHPTVQENNAAWS